MNAETETLIELIGGWLISMMRAQSGQDGWTRKDLSASASQRVVSTRRIQADG